MSSLYEANRPDTFDALVGQERACKVLSRLSLGGRAFWITGSSGTGKTTLARIIASKVAESWSTYETDGERFGPGELTELEAGCRFRPLGRGIAWIVDEAHRLKPSAIARLLTILEWLPEWVSIVFTTTSEAQESLFDGKLDASPLLSRCLPIKLARRGLKKPFAIRCREIAIAAGLDGKPIGDYEKLAVRCKNNLRAMLQEVEIGSMRES